MRKLFEFTIPVRLPSKNILDKMHWAKEHRLRNILKALVQEAVVATGLASSSGAGATAPAGTLTTSTRKRASTEWLKLEYYSAMTSQRSAGWRRLTAAAARAEKRQRR